MRAALYARFSSDLQSDASVEDQLRLCRALAEREGYTVVAEFQDAAISGYAIGSRPGVQALLSLAMSGGCDAVIAEHTDRLARRGSAGSLIFEDLEAQGVVYMTVMEGAITEEAQNISNLVSGLKLKEVRRRTRRGLEGVVLSGRSAGGCAFGYRVPIAYDARGERIRGLREIDEAEAAVVRRIYRDFASGKSPLTIADALNREGVPAPRGAHWLASAILGSARRGVGILRNPIYHGVRVWGVNGTVKDRMSGRRKTIAGTGSVTRMPAPEMQIVEDGLWAAVQRRLSETAVGPNGEGSGRRRPVHLLSGLIRCDGCGGIMTSAGTGGYLRCSGRSNRGVSTCTNTRNPSYPRIEATVLRGVKANLLHPAMIEEALKAFRQTVASERKSLAQQRGPLESQLADIQRRAARLVREVEDGMPWSLAKGRHTELLAQQAAVEAQLRQVPASEVVALHTGVAEAYRGYVDALGQELGEADHSESRNAIRGLISEIRFVPLEGKGAFELDIFADLSPVLMERNGLDTRASGDNTVTFQPVARVPVHFRLAG